MIHLFLYHRSSNLFLVQIENYDTYLSFEFWECIHEFFPFGFTIAKTVHLRSSTDDKLCSVIKMHIEGTKHITRTKLDSVNAPPVDFVSNVKITFENEVKLDDRV